MGLKGTGCEFVTLNQPAYYMVKRWAFMKEIMFILLWKYLFFWKDSISWHSKIIPQFECNFQSNFR